MLPSRPSSKTFAFSALKVLRAKRDASLFHGAMHIENEYECTSMQTKAIKASKPCIRCGSQPYPICRHDHWHLCISLALALSHFQSKKSAVHKSRRRHIGHLLYSPWRLAIKNCCKCIISLQNFWHVCENNKLSDIESLPADLLYADGSCVLILPQPLLPWTESRGWFQSRAVLVYTD